MIWTPHLTVSAVIERDNKFLMVKELADSQIVYNQPAGHVENKETIVDAVIREVNEETTWQFTPEYIVGLYKWRKADIDITFIRLCFAGKVHGHTPSQALDDGIISADWIANDDLFALPSNELRSPMVLSCIDDYRQGKHFPLDFIKEW